MALLGDAGRSIPGAYKPGTGTITFVNESTAYAKPDQLNYGRVVYIHGGLADKSCQYKLNTKYKIGDRVKFTYVKAMRPQLGCEWAAINLDKVEDGRRQSESGGREDSDDSDKGSVASGVSFATVSSRGWDGAGNDRSELGQGFVRNAKGRIDYNGISFAYIKLDLPAYGRAFMADRSVNGNYRENGVFSLAKAFPLSTRVVCDLLPQVDRKGCKYFAKNVVVDESKDEKSMEENSNSDDAIDRELDMLLLNTGGAARNGSVATSRRPLLSTPPQPVYVGRDRLGTTDTADKRSPNECNDVKPAKLADVSLQTDALAEISMLEKIFNDEEVFRVICTRLPDVMYQYTRIRNRCSFDK